jgi:hypothetical protein
MSNTIHKFDVPTAATFTLRLPDEAQVLTVQVQNGEPRLWVVVNTDELFMVTRTFLLYGTGHPLPDDLSGHLYIGTFQRERLVFHLFEDLAAPRNGAYTDVRR